MRKRTLGVIAATVATAATLVPAATAGQTFTTEIQVVDTDELSGNRLGLLGELISSRPRCEAERVVKLLISPSKSGPFTVVDTGRTSSHGTFGLSLDLDKDVGRARIRATLKRLSPSKTCIAETSPLVF